MDKQISKSERSEILREVNLCLAETRDLAEHYLRAGKLIASAVDRQPDFIESIWRDAPGIPKDAWRKLELAGRGRLIKDLILDCSPGAIKLCGYKVEMQEKLYKNPVSVAKLTNGGVIFETKPISHLSEEEARIKFGPTGPRNDDEMIALLQQRQQRERAATLRYRIADGKIRFLGSPEFEIKPLIELLKQVLGKDLPSV